MASEPEKKARETNSLRSLLPLIPSRSGTRDGSPRAVLSLAIASGATLLIPVAVRRVVDLGFTAESAAFISQYFSVLLGVVAVLALASAGATTS